MWIWMLSAALGQQAPAPPAGPEDIVLPYAQAVDTEALRAADRAQLARFASRAELVVVGNVIATRPDTQTANQAQIVTLFIEERIRGEAIGMVEFSVPLVYIEGETRPPVIEGYRLLVFLGSANALVDDVGLYYIEAGHAWRNRRDELFLRPSADRDWVDSIDPIVDYVVIPLAEVRAAVAAPTSGSADTPRKRRRWFGRDRD